MILLKALLAGVMLAIPVAAKADDVPNLNVEPVCDGIAKQGGVTFHDPQIAREKKNCLDTEASVRNELVKQWAKFDRSDRNSCVNESEMGGESSYTELLTCLEMARDVRALRAEQEGIAGAQSPPAKSGRKAPQ
jgi:hypothetical protein